MNKKIIILDLDNTLLDSKGNISSYSIKCLNNYEKEGHMVVLTSQKNFGEMNNLHHKINLKSPMICHGGAELHFYNKENENIVMSIDINTLKDIFKENYDYINSAFYHYKRNLYLHKRLDILYPLYGITSDTKIFENDYLKMELQYPNMIFMVIKIEYLNQFLENMKKYSDYLELQTLGQDNTVALYYLNIKHVNKSYAILELLIHFNKKEKDLIIVGDSDKDVAMLSLNGTTCAMKNGSKEAKETAKYISEFDNNNDGAVKFINSILKKND